MHLLVYFILRETVINASIVHICLEQSIILDKEIVDNIKYIINRI